jgi:hypothetical protein
VPTASWWRTIPHPQHIGRGLERVSQQGIARREGAGREHPAGPGHRHQRGALGRRTVDAGNSYQALEIFDDPLVVDRREYGLLQLGGHDPKRAWI